MRIPCKKNCFLSTKIILLIFLFLFNINNPISIYGQISPGELSSAHSIFDGVVYCNKCHFIGNEADNTKCLDCHTEIGALIEQGRGYHSSSEVSENNCWDCHNEHYGKDFQLIWFEKDDFSHELTGFKLQGKHSELKCKKCHNIKNVLKGFHKIQDNFSLSDIEENEQSFESCKECHIIPNKIDGEDNIKDIGYLGLNPQCITCHNDYHQGTLGINCKSCHSDKQFRPADLFDHQKTDFELTGSHQKLDCVKCHKKEIRNEKDYQVFSDMKSEKCTDCHTNKHNQKFGIKCQECHITESFLKVNKKTFDHSKTNFQLQGKHENLECQKCHKEKISVLKPNAAKCSNCHEPKHVFNKNIKKDCSECHTVKGFFPSTFTIEKHKKLEFALQESHLAVSCNKCHLKENKWNFNNTHKDCFDCHKSAHQDELPEKYINPGGCTNCHNQKAWDNINFEHSKTGYNLKGKHLKLECKSCHVEIKDGSNKIIKFASNDQDCSKCHKDNHQNQFDKNGVTVCKTCHFQESWKPELFKHNETNFKLEGKHKELECFKCHLLVNKNNVIYRNFKLRGVTCSNCHSR